MAPGSGRSKRAVAARSQVPRAMRKPLTVRSTLLPWTAPRSWSLCTSPGGEDTAKSSFLTCVGHVLDDRFPGFHGVIGPVSKRDRFHWIFPACRDEQPSLSLSLSFLPYLCFFAGRQAGMEAQTNVLKSCGNYGRSLGPKCFICLWAVSQHN